jgi:hypothetical protein
MRRAFTSNRRFRGVMGAAANPYDNASREGALGKPMGTISAAPGLNDEQKSELDEVDRRAENKDLRLRENGAAYENRRL